MTPEEEKKMRGSAGRWHRKAKTYTNKQNWSCCQTDECHNL